MQRLLTSRGWPLAPQVAIAAACAATVAALALGPENAEFNAGMYLLWSLWWAVLPLSFAVLGRTWCAICPVSLLGDAAGKAFPGRAALPDRGESAAVLFVVVLAAIHLADLWFRLEEDRHATGILLAALGFAAFALTLTFSGRWWCRTLCPVGGLGSFLARLSPLRIGNGAAPCPRECADRACTGGRAVGALCPVGLDLRAGIDPGACILCGACLKACSRLDGIVWGVPARDRAAIRPATAGSLADLAFLGLAVDMALTHLADWPIHFWRLSSAAGIAAGPWAETLLHVGIIAAPPLAALSFRLGRRGAAPAEPRLAALAVPALPLAGAAVLALSLRALLVEGPLHLQGLLLAGGWDGPPLLGGVRLLDGMPLRIIQESLVLAGALLASVRIREDLARGGTRRGALAGAAATLAGAALLLWVFSKPMLE